MGLDVRFAYYQACRPSQSDSTRLRRFRLKNLPQATFFASKPSRVRSHCYINKKLQVVKTHSSFKMVETVGLDVRFAYYQACRPSQSDSTRLRRFRLKNLPQATFFASKPSRVRSHCYINKKLQVVKTHSSFKMVETVGLEPMTF